MFGSISRTFFHHTARRFSGSGVNQYYDSLNEGKYGNATVDRIVKFIKNNYSNPDLSITAISEYINLSPPIFAICLKILPKSPSIILSSTIECKKLNNC